MNKLVDINVFGEKKYFKTLMIIPFYGALIALAVLIINKKREDPSFHYLEKFFGAAFYMALFILPIIIPAQIISALYPDYSIYFFIGAMIMAWVPADIAFIKVYKKIEKISHN